MQPKQRWLFLLFIISISCVTCQRAAAQNEFSVLLSPALVPLSPTQLTLQPGVQWRLQHWGLLAQVAFPLYKHSDEYADLRYLRRSLELKRYFKQRRDWEEFLSVEVMYARRTFTDTNGGTYFKGIYNERFAYSRARIESPVFSIAVKAGATFFVSKKIVMDAFAGLGARTITTRYSNIENETAQPYGWLEISGPKSALRYDKTFSKPHLTCGFKFGYTL